MNRSHGMIKIQFPLQDSQSDKLLFSVFHIGSMENQHPCLRPEGLEYYQLIICTSGSGYLSVKGQEFTILPGMGFLLKPGVAHEYYSTGSPWTTYWILFNGAGVLMLPFIINTDDFKVFFISNMDKMLFLHQEMYALAEANAIKNRNALSAGCYEFLLEMADNISEDSNLNLKQNEVRLDKVIRYLEENYSKDIVLEDLAKLVDITPQYLCRLFQSNLQMRPMEYVLYLRMKEAKRLLLTQKDFSLNKIGDAVGYHDTSYFCRMFKKNTGLTPGEFKKTIMP